MIKLADTLAPMSNDFYAVESENVGIDIDGTSKSIQQAYEDGDLSGGGSSIQVDIMPIASEYPNEIVQYVGESGTYQNGYFYQSTSDEQNPPTYSWVQKNVQPNAESFTFNEDDFNIDSSTDEVSLLPSRRVFNGSKADWDLLSVAEKTQYGATAFTDDEGDGMDSPVDVVESGNMHAVTSNAVANITSSKIGFLSGKSTDIIDAFSQVGIPNDFYSKTIKQFCDNIFSYSSGVHSLSIGGPAYGFVLWKHDNEHFAIDMLSYSDFVDNIIRVIKSNETYTVCRYVR